MDQELICTRVGHDSQKIIGICMKKECSHEPRICCVKCLLKTGYHFNCNEEFTAKEDFIKILKQLMTVSHIPQVIQDLKQARINLINSIKVLEQYLEKIFLKYDEEKRNDRINKILNTESLSLRDWRDGYDILTNEFNSLPQYTDLLNELRQIKRSVDKVACSKDEIDKKLIKCNWNTITPQNPLIIKETEEIRTISLSPDGRYIASAGHDQCIKIWDPCTGYQIGKGMKGHKESISSISYSKDGKYIISGSNDQTIRQWNVETQQQFGDKIQIDSGVIGVQYSPDQTYIVSCSMSNFIQFWNPETGKEFSDKQYKSENYIGCFCLNPKGNDVAFGDNMGNITIYDYESCQKHGNQLKVPGGVRSLQYSADRRYIVSGGKDKTVRVWNLITKQQIASFSGHTDDISSVSFSSDMKYIISGGYDNTVKLWELATEKQIAGLLQHHNMIIYSTQFSIDGKYIITGGSDKQLIIMVTPIEMNQ